MDIRMKKRGIIFFWTLSILVFDSVSYTVKPKFPVSFKFGQPPELFTDKPGPPLDTKDFKRVSILERVGDEGFQSNQIDPIEIAGLFQGDIVLNSLEEYQQLISNDRTSHINLRNAIINLERRWPKGEIPYLISSVFNENERAMIAKAVFLIQNNTCIRFLPRTNQLDYIHILKGNGCSSSVGQIGGPQSVSIGTGCFYPGIIMHELMHTTGFWHEHSRGDRDASIQIIWSNILQGMRVNFDKYDWNTIQSLGIEYDLGSIMHYGPYAFSKDRTKPTIIPKRRIEIGQRRNFSKKDILKMNTLYNCPGSSFPGNACVDNNDHCVAWAVLGECEKNPKWMEKNCKKSCTQCGDRPLCEDTHIHCQTWAELGECKANPYFMLIYCQFSCGSCL